MKISKSKQELARIISENGGWRERAKFSAQDKDGGVFHYSTKPTIGAGCEVWYHMGCIGEGEFYAETLPNWHQTVLSRAEYFHLYPAPDADGWIEWRGGEFPVEPIQGVDVMRGDGFKYTSRAENFNWLAKLGPHCVTAYRLHKPEQVGATEKLSDEAVLSARSALMSDSIEELVRKPTIEKLAADYRNAKDYADRKQEEADTAKADADEKLRVLELAGEALGLIVSPITEKQEPELVITDWRDLRVGDEIEVFNFECPWNESSRKQELMSGPCVVMQAEGGNARIELKKNLPTNGPHWNATGIDACDFKLIRRP